MQSLLLIFMNTAGDKHLILGGEKENSQLLRTAIFKQISSVFWSLNMQKISDRFFFLLNCVMLHILITFPSEKSQLFFQRKHKTTEVRL